MLISNNLYRSVFDSAPYAFLVLSEDLKVIQCNHNCEVLLSRTEKEMLGRCLVEVVPHKELRDRVEAVLQNKGVKLVELHFENENSKVLRAVVSDLSATDQNGGALCLITLEDISERVQLENQLIQSEKLAGMGLLATSIAHELGNPLTIMNSTLQYVRDTLLNKKSKAAVQNKDMAEAVETIMDSVRQMHGILRTLSEFTGSQRPRFEPTDLRRVLSQMLAFIHKEAEARKIKISHRLEDNLPICQVDHREVSQVFLNLLKNAMEAMPDGGKLRVRIYPLGEDMIRIDISDTGVGIRDTELRSIFRPFYSTKPSGTGLGLSFCRRVVEEHGGEIKVESRLHKGSTFSVILPIRQGETHDSETPVRE